MENKTWVVDITTWSGTRYKLYAATIGQAEDLLRKQPSIAVYSIAFREVR